MNYQQARNRFEAFCSPSEDPALSEAQVAELLALAVDADVDEFEPTDEGWTPTYSTRGVWRAVAEGWQMKAGIASSRFAFTTDGQTFQRQHVAAHCHAMAERYKRKLGISVSSSEA